MCGGGGGSEGHREYQITTIRVWRFVCGHFCAPEDQTDDLEQVAVIFFFTNKNTKEETKSREEKWQFSKFNAKTMGFLGVMAHGGRVGENRKRAESKGCRT